MKKALLPLCILVLLIAVGQITPTAASMPAVSLPVMAAYTQPLIIDHENTDITVIPQQWIEAAKNTLHVYYGHTSHGSQLTTGMGGLVDFANGGGLGLSLPQDIFDGLPMQEASPDAGYWPTWRDNTVTYLGPPDPVTGRGTSHPDTNVVIWSWCGQMTGISEDDLNNHYLLPMTQLENDYPGITFVYMTGHSDGVGEDSNLHQRNTQVRQYAIDNNKVLYDFYDIELYDPDGNYYGDKDMDDTCWYDSDGNGSLDANWCLDWQAAHTEDDDWYDVSCAHSEAIICNQKAYAAWWLWTSIAGWNQPSADPDLSPSSKAASQSTVVLSDTVTYTLQIVSADGPLTNTVYITDTVPTGLIYVPGSLTATSGSVDDSSAPDLLWSGQLTPSPTITITYAVTVDVSTPQAITNTVVIETPDYDPITRSATIIVNGYQVYLPIIRR